MRKYTRFLALLLAFVLCFTACASSDVTPEVAPSADTPTENNNQEESAQVNYWDLLDTVNDSSDLPDWTGETLDVNIWYAGGLNTDIPDIAEEDVFFKEVERVTGIRFNFEDSFDNGGDNIDAKLPQVVASQNFPTLMYGFDTMAQMRELYDNGYLADLTEYYENGSLDHVLYWAPTTEAFDVFWDNYRTEDGKYFTITGAATASHYNFTEYYPEEYDPAYYNNYGITPSSATGAHFGSCIYIRDDVLKALYPEAHTAEELAQIYVDKGTYTEDEIFDVKIESTEEFWQLLYDIQNLLAGGEFSGLDGRTMEVTYGPDTDTDNWPWMVALPMAANGYPLSTDYFVSGNREGNADSILEYAFVSDEYVSWMKDLNKLVNDDVISQDSLVDNNATFNEKYLNGHYAVTYGYQSTFTNTINSGDGQWSYRPLWLDIPLQENFGGFTSLGGHTSCWGIFKNDLSDDQIAQLVHALDFLSSPVGIKLGFWGPASAGLFTEDAEGNRTYTDADLAACMLNGVDNGASTKYGLLSNTATSANIGDVPNSREGSIVLAPSYLNAANVERVADTYAKYYNPAQIPGKSLADNETKITNNCEVYALGMSIEGIKQFWAGRAGFENQMKKVIVAENDEVFAKELALLEEYATENGLTEETLKEFNELFVATNEAMLKFHGLIE